jgi:spermidine/putrescine transport system ATP-binding protein
MTNLLNCQQLSKSFDGNPVLQSVNLSVNSGEFLTLLGPSGCGKTTLLRLIAGLESIDSGTIHIQNTDCTHLPPAERPLHVVFQQYALFPHLSVFDNVAFGLACANVAKPERKQRVEQTLQRVNLLDHQHKKPHQLSGGQQQRVAIARAIVLQPLILLLDEPFSALDYKLRVQTRLELKKLQRELNMTFILVTHDQEEALTLSDRIAVMNHGNIEQIGTPREVYEKPRNLFVAQFIGDANILPREDGSKLLIRPEDMEAWGLDEVPTDKTNRLPATVEEIIYKGSTVDLVVRLENSDKFAVTEFFNEDDDKLIYTRGEKVILTWQAGWEVILKDE